jgi:hypothetical protein
MPRAARSSPIARASDTDRASRSSMGHEGVAFTDGGDGLVEAGTGAVGAGEAVVQVDAFLREPELAEPVALGGDVLVVGGAAGVTDQGLGHGRERTFSPRQSASDSRSLSRLMMLTVPTPLPALRRNATVDGSNRSVSDRGAPGTSVW